MPELLQKGEYYGTISETDCCVDIWKHATNKSLYVVDISGLNNTVTTVVQKRKYRKELDELFFIPRAAELWRENEIIEAIRRDRISA